MAGHEGHQWSSAWCYIDESGDEGLVWKDDGGVTRWLVTAAVVVEDRDDLNTSRAADRVKNRLGLKVERPLHWGKRRDHWQRRVIVEELPKEPITVICVAVHKPSLDQSGTCTVRPGSITTPPASYLRGCRGSWMGSVVVSTWCSRAGKLSRTGDRASASAV